MITRKLFLALLVLFPCTPLSADAILYSLEDLGNNRWQYNYAISNSSLSELNAFTVFFDLGVYENLFVESSAADWDSFAADPDPGLPDDGFFDSVALLAGILMGEELTGFGVSFDFLGAGSPGDQFFLFYDPFSFDVLAEGMTRLRPVSVSEPTSLGLLAAGLIVILLRLRRLLMNVSDQQHT